MNPNIIVLGWVFTLFFIGLLVTGSTFWWVPVSLFSLVVCIGLLPESKPAKRYPRMGR